MTNDELKTALFNGCQIEYQGIIYKCVTAIIYRNKGGKLDISAELLDKNDNSVSIVEPYLVKEIIL